MSLFDSMANRIWVYGIDPPDSVGLDLIAIAETPEQDFLSTGSILYREPGHEIGPYKYGDLVVAKVDVHGQEIWQTAIPVDTSVGRDYGQGIALDENGNILVVGTANYSGGLGVTTQLFLTKLDPDGGLLWSKSFEFGEDIWHSEGGRIVSNEDNTFTILGQITSMTARKFVLIKIDSEGEVIWEKRFPYSNDSNYFNSGGLSKTPGGGYVFGGAKQFNIGFARDIFLIKADDQGNEEWLKVFESPGDDKLMDVEQGHEGSIVLTGALGSSVLGDEDLVFKKLNAEGEEIWSRIHGGMGRDLGSALKPAADTGYMLIGYKGGFTFFNGNYTNVLYTHFFKTDSLGLISTSKITGHIFDDFDLDCTYNGEEGKMNWLVEATANGETYYGIADSSGFYCLPLDTGDYQLRLITSSPYWESCEDSLLVSLSPYDTLTVDFPAQPAIDCPYLEVDISTTFLRRCFENIYTVSYCNQGTVPAENAYVEVDLDENLDFISSSIPFSHQDGHFFTFQVGDIQPGDCGSFTINVVVNCDSTEIGQTHCSEARIFPNEICLESPDWSGASIELGASCDGDSVTFTIKNVGTAPTSEPINYLVIEDQVILIQDNTTLEPGEDQMITIPASGATLRLEADQEPNHPGNDMPSIAVEGCGSEDGTFSMGYVTQFPENDGNPFVSIDCRENIGSWDPNDKQAFPKGYGETHLIEPNTDLEYLIRFQNTGTDTAFNIVIRDPISPLLDLTSLKMGTSSHPYRFDIQEDRILTIYFDHIMLPDSNINEVASHGFVKFRIKQLKDNPIGQEIENTAFIYFDFNPPVVTNRVVHTIGVDFLEGIIIEDPGPAYPAKVFPNPFEEETNIEIPGFEGELLDMRLLDMSGRLIRESRHTGPDFVFSRNALPAGLYFYQIQIGKRVINSGKIVIQ